jgi:ankyrin repeat protein
MVQASVTTGWVDPDWTCKEAMWQLPLALAAEHEHVDVVNFLIAAGADVNKRGNLLGVTAAYQAAGFNSVRSLQSLADAGADMNLGSSSNGSTPLLIATESNSIAAVKVLVAAGAELKRTNERGANPLLLAAKEGFIEIVEILLQAEADTNVQLPPLGIGPIGIALTFNKTAVVAAIRNTHLAETRGGL